MAMVLIKNIVTLKKTIAVGSLGDDISTLLIKLQANQLNSCTELKSKITNLDNDHLVTLIGLLSMALALN